MANFCENPIFGKNLFYGWLTFCANPISGKIFILEIYVRKLSTNQIARFLPRGTQGYYHSACPSVGPSVRACKHDNLVKNDGIWMELSGIVFWVIRMNPVEFWPIWAKTCPGMPVLVVGPNWPKYLVSTISQSKMM